jgi:tRNA U54 and U55 pseudouridine synthase Pus10
MTEAEAARKMMLDMRRVLMSKPEELVFTDEVKAQQKLIFSLDCLDEPLVENDIIGNNASIQNAVLILKTFSRVQMYSTAHLNRSDKAYEAWHKYIGKNSRKETINLNILQ